MTHRTQKGRDWPRPRCPGGPGERHCLLGSCWARDQFEGFAVDVMLALWQPYMRCREERKDMRDEGSNEAKKREEVSKSESKDATHVYKRTRFIHTQSLGVLYCRLQARRRWEGRAKRGSSLRHSDRPNAVNEPLCIRFDGTAGLATYLRDQIGSLGHLLLGYRGGGWAIAT